MKIHIQIRPDHGYYSPLYFIIISDVESGRRKQRKQSPSDRPTDLEQCIIDILHRPDGTDGDCTQHSNRPHLLEKDSNTCPYEQRRHVQDRHNFDRNCSQYSDPASPDHRKAMPRCFYARVSCVRTVELNAVRSSRTILCVMSTCKKFNPKN